MKLLRSLELTVKSISAAHILPPSNDSSSITMLARVHGLAATVELGEPRKRNNLHYEHLSSRCVDDEDDFGTAVSAAFSTKNIAIHRREPEALSTLSRVVSIGSVALNCLTSNWLPLGPRMQLFPGDANASFVALKLAVVSPQLSDRLDRLVDVLDRMPQKSTDKSGGRNSRSPVMRNVPRVHLELGVDDIAACIRPGGQSDDDSSALILSSTQCTVSASSYFRSFCTSKSNLLPNDCSPLDLVISYRCVLGPAFVMSVASPLPLDGKTPMSPETRVSHGGDPLLSFTAIEVEGSSQILGGLAFDGVMADLDLSSVMSEFSSIAEVVSVELWQPASTLTLQRLMSSLKLSGNTPKDSGRNVFDAFPRGLTAHFAIGEFAVILTGKDLNPKEDLDLSRGIGLKSGLAFQICTLDEREQFKRLPKRFPQARDRSRLLLFEGLTTEAIAVTTSLKQAPKKLVLSRLSLWDLSVRMAVATEFAADLPYDSDDVKEIAELEFLWVKRLEVNVVYSHLDPRETSIGQKRLQVSIKIPYIRSHFQLPNAYCTLLALQTIRSLAMTQSPSKMKASSRALAVSLRVSVHTIQVLLNLPLEESTCIRVNNLNIRNTEPGDFQVDYGTLFIWVPTAREDSRWEELLRLRHWKSSFRGTDLSSLHINIFCDGARLRIPHKYILADLILSLNVFAKSLKHLRAVMDKDRFSDFGPPTVEDAKRVPSIAWTFGCLSLEAADDPFESTLGLITRVGMEAARSRAEREEAFKEKVDAIEAAGGDSDDEESRRFTPQHSVSVEEAHERLLLVHSISWCSQFRDAKEVQKKVEEGIKKKVHGNYFHYSGLDVPPLVSLALPEHSPPLLRIIASRFSVNISRPRFEEERLADFLHDLGKGIPRDTQYSLLIPLHLNFAIGASCVTLRDYPLPILNIVQDSPDAHTAWVVDGDFVVAEEIGSHSSVTWKECIIVPAGSGVSGSAEFRISVPKTTMPVKTYTNLTVNVVTSQLTEFCWAVSYAPALQDMMRIMDTISTPPPDPSPVLGFWDKVSGVVSFLWNLLTPLIAETHSSLPSNDQFRERSPVELER